MGGNIKPKVQVPKDPTIFKNATKFGITIAKTVKRMTISILSIKTLTLWTNLESVLLLKKPNFSTNSKQQSI